MHHDLLLRAAAGREELSVLEVAAGSATALAAAARRFGRLIPPLELEVTLSDRLGSHLPRSWDPELPQPALLEADATELPLPAKSVDVVSCCLFVHHLPPEAVRLFLVEAIRVARVAVVINDLERTRLHYALARLFSLVDPSRLSSHDGPVSVRQAYSAAEMCMLLAETGHRWELRRRFLYRLAATVWVQERAPLAGGVCST